MARNPARQSGFTLLEVLAALAVLAIALGALVGAAGGSAGRAAYLRDKMLAHWVAMNRAVRYQIAAARPQVGPASGTAEMAGRLWFWHAQVSGGPDSDVRRVHIEVAAVRRREAPLARVDLLVPRP